MKNGILEDPQYKIVEVLKYGNRMCDPKKLKESNPTVWKAYEQAYNEKAKQDADALIQKAKDRRKQSFVGVGRQNFGKKNVDLCSQIPATIAYEVRKK